MRDRRANQAEAPTPKHARAVFSRLERDIFPAIGRKSVTAIEPPEILQAPRKVEERRALDVARRLLQSVSAVFRYAVAAGLATRDPAAHLGDALEPKPKTRHMARIPAGEPPEFLGRLARHDGAAQTRIAVLLTLHAAVRTNELRLARWDEVGRDLWRIPPERMKMGREHLVPLSPTARSLFAQLRTIAGDSPWMVPGLKGKPISRNTMIFALYRMGYRSKLTIHGFRAMFSTILNEKRKELGFEQDWIERQLAHVEGNSVRGAYNAAEYLADRRRMMNWWSGYLDAQRDLADLL